jgi:glycosyltransferase involved in cell wall biosynthesis
MSSQPSLLFVLNSLGVGGSEIKIIKVANALVRSGTAVELAYLNPVETSLSMIDPAVPVTCLDRRGKYSFSSLRRLGELVNRERQTVVAVNPYPLLYVVPAVKWCKLSNIKCVGLVNSMDLFGRERMYGRLFAQFLRRCDQILPLERSLIIYNGVDHEYYSPTIRAKEGILLRQQLQIPENAVVVGSIGRLAPVKNYDKLIIALANLSAAGREAYAILGGEGADRERLERLAAAKGVAGRVKFLGVLRDVRSAMSAMDIFVLPSASETFSNAALEAMAMARAVVLSEAGGAAEMVEHGESGLLFDVGDVDALSESLVILHNSRELRERLGAAARKRVIAAFGSEDMVDCYRRLSQS